jgi:hypothetical protein
MPKRYKVRFKPHDNTEPTSTATFTKVEDDNADPSPAHPQDETVPKHARKKLEDDGAAKHRDRWTGAEIKDLLGVKLRESKK